MVAGVSWSLFVLVCWFCLTAGMVSAMVDCSRPGRAIARFYASRCAVCGLLAWRCPYARHGQHGGRVRVEGLGHYLGGGAR